MQADNKNVKTLKSSDTEVPRAQKRFMVTFLKRTAKFSVLLASAVVWGVVTGILGVYFGDDRTLSSMMPIGIAGSLLIVAYATFRLLDSWFMHAQARRGRFIQLALLGLAGFVYLTVAWGVVASSRTMTAAKPVIYLYPETTTEVTVRLDYDGTLIADYPPYDEKLGGWEVTAQPDGTLTNHADGREYSYLFWEGTPASPVNWDLSTGFVVPGSDTREFLQGKLAEIGLTPREYNEFVVYWYPKMKDNPYNLIHFAGEQYTDTAPLTITPTPDSMLRVFMVYKPLTHPVDVTPQTFTPRTRTGFTVVEWGGAEIR